jgi:hypothetical protein
MVLLDMLMLMPNSFFFSSISLFKYPYSTFLPTDLAVLCCLEYSKEMASVHLDSASLSFFFLAFVLPFGQPQTPDFSSGVPSD